MAGSALRGAAMVAAAGLVGLTFAPVAQGSTLRTVGGAVLCGPTILKVDPGARVINSHARHIRGTMGNDVILVTGPGRHTVHARGGDDVICGSTGVDIVRGGRGNDLVYGMAGRDRLYGGPGSDHLMGGDGDDRIRGNRGNDDVADDQATRDDDDEEDSAERSPGGRRDLD